LEAAREMHFETAAALRDEMYALKKELSRRLGDLPVGVALELAESGDLPRPGRRPAPPAPAPGEPGSRGGVRRRR